MRCVRILPAALCLLLAACTSGRSATQTDPRSSPAVPTPARATTVTPGGSAIAPRIADWPTYHGGPARSGFSPRPVLHRGLQVSWSRTLDGAVYAQPVVANGMVIAATENDSVYALGAGDGRVMWRRHLGEPVPGSRLPCGNIDPLGITGTPAYDAATGKLFVVTESGGARHDLHALDIGSGREVWHRSLDVVDRDPHAQQQRSALLVAHRHVYVAFGGLFGDCGNYVGYVTSVAVDGRGPVGHYSVPAQREAGIWAPPGPVLEPAGTLLVAIGNGSSTGSAFDGSDSVVRLSPSLQPLGFFAPATWAQDNSEDLDLGSSSPVQVGKRILVAGKRGTAYLLAPDLGGIGAQLDTLEGCAAFGGAASVGSLAVLPCADGIRRLDVVGSRMAWRWQVRGVPGSPLIVGDSVLAVSPDTGDLYAVDLAGGQVEDKVHVGEVTRFATPAPVGDGVVVGTKRGVVCVRGG